MDDTERSPDRRVPWSPGIDIPIRPSIAIDRAKWAIQRYAELGIHQPHGNRLEESRDFLAQFAGGKGPLDGADEDLLHRIAECSQTCFEHYLIAQSTSTSSGKLSPEMVRKLKESLAGADVADHERDSPGRDTQFELFIYALLLMGDVLVWIAEPDLRFLYNGQEVGLAAKRIKRSRRLRQRFNDAVEQIKRSGVRGFVAVNADLLIRNLGSMGSAAELGAEVEKGLQAFRPIDDEFVSHPLVLGRLVFGTAAVWPPGHNRPELEICSYRSYVVYAKSSEEERAGLQFFPPMLARIRQHLAQLQ